MNQNIKKLFNRFDKEMIRLMETYSIDVLRVALALVFIWFGALKITGDSPVSDLVANTVPWPPPEFFVPFLGVWEVAVGLGLLFKFALRMTLFLFWLQMAGTFLVLILQPGVAFQNGNPLLLTMEGEFVVKNLVLVASGLVVGSTVRHRETSGPPSEQTT